MEPQKDSKIKLGMLKGKSLNTSVPSIAIKFNTNFEQLEYGIEDDSIQNPNNNTTKLLSNNVKRSTSVDISNTNASPSSDTWKFFSGIKEIAKSVEGRITEIKSRNLDENSPIKKSLNNKENSSVSDSEEISESSISRTCGVVSTTTEGVEMSSDDEFNSVLSLDNHPSALRQRFKLFKNKSLIKEGTLCKNTLVQLYNANKEDFDQIVPGKDNTVHSDNIENAIDALDESIFNNKNGEIVENISEIYNNITLDNDNTMIINEINGNEITNLSGGTYFSPIGFIDCRLLNKNLKKHTNYTILILLVLFIIFNFFIKYISPYVAGLILGLTIGFVFNYICWFLNSNIDVDNNNSNKFDNINNNKPENSILLSPIKEYKELLKFEGWMNEYPDNYDPLTYNINRTQSVYLHLQGNLLRISNTKNKIPKRALWNEKKINAIFTYHRIYNLLNAKILLLPIGLAKKRQWSKKYPICIILNKEQINCSKHLSEIEFDNYENDYDDHDNNNNDDDDDCYINNNENNKKNQGTLKTNVKIKKQTLHYLKKSSPNNNMMNQRFSKLCEDKDYEIFELESDLSRPSTPSSSDINEEWSNPIIKTKNNESSQNIKEYGKEENNLLSDTKIYLFARTDREKEEWYNRLKKASYSDINYEIENINDKKYLKYLLSFNINNDKENNINEDNSWINTLLHRILFDFLHDPLFTEQIKNRIERKLSTIKLPYFIENLRVTDLNLGDKSPLIKQTFKPINNERGLWIDFNIDYKGLILLTLQINLNLIKLKQPSNIQEKSPVNNEKLAIFHSDIDDSAENTSDDEEETNILIESGMKDTLYINQSLSSTSNVPNTKRKFIKMVDRIADSKFFQAATENRFIKKAIENVSNTDIRLHVELKELIGTLVLNIPSPPTDRIWVGFRPTPHLNISAYPIVGERNITMLNITNWIEKQLQLEFQKYFVIPNMEDIIIPFLCPK